MCDTMVIVPCGSHESAPVWFGKNSDREPGEAQVVEHLPRRRAQGSTLRATHVEIAEVSDALEVALSRPAWMWGAEMGANERGVVIGNEAVFTRVEVAPRGLTGMDLLRIALERATSADDALELITGMLSRHGQGGRCGYRQEGFRYHNAFMIADPGGAWLLETAGRFWAAERVAGIRTTSNVLTIGEGATRVGPGTIDEARRRGWLRRGEEFSFRRAYARPLMAVLSGGDVRREHTSRVLSGSGGLGGLLAALRSHGDVERATARLRMTAPCAHASLLPTRSAGQTTGSMVSRLDRSRSTHLFTGTSSPCLSVFKPVPLGRGPVDTGPPPGGRGFDPASLFWRHERLHRAVLRDEAPRREIVAPPRAELEMRLLARADEASADEASAGWAAHREALPGWLAVVTARPPLRRATARDGYWRAMSFLDRIPR